LFFVTWYPTAVQLDGDVHETPKTVLEVAVGWVGMAWTVQAAPVQCRASGVCAPELVNVCPTAMQENAPAQEMLFSSLAPPWGRRVGRSVHVLPFQCSTTRPLWPTAVQSATVGHEIAVNWFRLVLFGVG
jgi:hypothetical protein